MGCNNVWTINLEMNQIHKVIHYAKKLCEIDFRIRQEVYLVSEKKKKKKFKIDTGKRTVK